MSRAGRAARAGRAGRAAAAVVAIGSLLLAACTTRQPEAAGIPTERGGTLRVLMDTRVQSWDPQRIGTAGESAFAVRTFLRTLTAQAPAGTGFLPGLVGDLATTTGRVEDGGRTWSFTLVADAPWQDGRFVTCADVKYGVSRSFARDRVSGGSQEAVRLLDIPTRPDPQGRTVSAYEGPYSGVGQDLFDKAVTCTGRQITFHLNTPRYDFDQIVSLPAFAPVRQDQDTDRSGPLSVFSSGPYMLEGVWKPGKGGRFVRNRKWVAHTDPVRMAWPDVIEVEEGLPTTVVAQRLVDDQGLDRNAVSWADMPSAMGAELATPSLAMRVTRPDSGIVDVLLPATSASPASTAAGRRALAVATDRKAYASADGFPMTATTSVLARNIPGRPVTDPPGVSLGGDPAAARSVLLASGLAPPVPLRVGYAASEAATRAVTALVPGWQQAGFAVTLVPEAAAGGGAGASSPTGAAGVQAAAGSPVDLQLTSVSAPWPAADAVLPGITDRAGDPALRAAASSALATADREARTLAWGDLAMRLVGAGDVVPLAERRHVHLRGSGIQAYVENVLLGGYPDLGSVSVQH